MTAYNATSIQIDSFMSLEQTVQGILMIGTGVDTPIVA